ncbi:MAG TPA: PD-(D/E)XK nuclease family protein, partial [Dermatophilaceae bacterium]|nr:PD-(D/E)XK nuclease family protein [Dermatophilaceae bacterium]
MLTLRRARLSAPLGAHPDGRPVSGFGAGSGAGAGAGVGEPAALDAIQRQAAAYRGPLLRVLGGPGTGKTTTAVEVVLDRVRSGEARPDQCLMLTSSRLAAASLRDRVTSQLGGTSTEPLARTHQSLGFGILRQAAALRGEPAPRLLSGPEQDVILRDLLAGHAAGAATAPVWPERVREALGTRGFRAELRDLLMRAVEHGLEADDLARLGRQHDRQEWVAGAQVLREYDQVTALSAAGAYDPAWILSAAADLLEDDAEALDRVASGLRLIVVDDAQELTSAAARLLRVLAGAGGGLAVVLVGDPDSAVQTFRGADPRFLADGWTALGEGPTLVLPTAYRLPAANREAAERVARKIGALGGGRQRAAAAGRRGGEVDVRLVRAVSQEAALVAAELREAHLRHGVPWSEMAVIVRGQGRTATLRRVLMAAGVPVGTAATDLPVRDEVAVRPLLALLRTVLDLARSHPAGSDSIDPLDSAGAVGPVVAIDPQVAVDVLMSPLGGADAVTLRRLRRSLRQAELDTGGGRTSDELLAEALLHEGLLAGIGAEGLAARRVARVIAAGVAAAAVRGDGGAARWAPGVTAESVLWAMWSASGLAGRWRDAALAGGPGGARADRDLDAVVGLFDAAATFVDRLPQAGPEQFLAHIASQDIPGDTLVARAPAGETVALLTPQAAAGREWRLVCVAGVQEGVWPDLRLRGSLLGSEHLVDVVTGRAGSFRGAQAAVRYDETRLFLVALTRASERVVVTAVRSDDEQPSVYLDVVDPLPDDCDGQREFTEVAGTMTLPSLVAQLRRELLDASPQVRGQAVSALARLAREGVPGADPAQWWALTMVSDDRPLRAPEESVPVSPSKVEAFGRCGLRWLLMACGGDGPPVGAADIGTLVHGIAADLGDADAETLAAEVDARWPRLGLPRGWVSDRKRDEAHAMVRRLAAYFDAARASGWTKLGAEVEMQVALGRVVLRGQVDRLEQAPDGRLRVIDYKTGSSKPKVEELARHPQLGAYQLAVQAGAFLGAGTTSAGTTSAGATSAGATSAGATTPGATSAGTASAGTTSAGAALLQIGKAANKGITLQSQPPLDADDEPGWAEALVRQAGEGMAAAEFTARTGEWCSQCQLKACCPLQP